MAEEKLAAFLKNGGDWGRMKTSVPGVFVLKLPAYKGAPTRLAVELNPVDDAGSPTRRRGLVLRSSAELEAYRGLFQFDKLATLLKSVDTVNPQLKKTVRAAKGEDILEL